MLFKVSALHKYCDYFPGGTLALDNDVALKISRIDALFGIFDDMSTKAYGFGLDGRCVPVAPDAIATRRPRTPSTRWWGVLHKFSPLYY